MKVRLKSLRVKVIIGVTLVAVLAAVGLSWLAFVSGKRWTRQRDVKLQLNGHSIDARVYRSPDKSAILVLPDKAEFFYFNLKTKKGYDVYADAIWVETPYFIIVARNPPHYDRLLNEDREPVPDYRMNGGTVSGNSLHGRITVSGI